MRYLRISSLASIEVYLEQLARNAQELLVTHEADVALAVAVEGASARRLTLLRYADMALGNFVGLGDAYAFARDCV